MYSLLLTIFLVTVGFVPGHLAAHDPTETKQQDEYSITIRMPNAVSDKDDALKCTTIQLDPEEAYIVKITPHASKKTAHHMMLYGCHIPANGKSPWTCDQSETYISSRSVCGDGPRQIFFAWALDAPEKALPEGVGLRVSGDTGVNFLVVQLHYAHAFPPGVTDNSGVTLTMTRKRPPQQASYLILGSWGKVPPQQPVVHLDASCIYRRNYTIYPIGFRTHSHNLGVVTSAYRIRDGEWTEIGRMSPQLPQTFYDVSNPGMDIRYGDELVSRCTMNSMDRYTDTYMGPRNHDEMCNFYIMYSTYEQGNLKDDFCFKGSQTYHWASEFKPGQIPANSGTLDGIKGAEEVLKKFRWA